MALSEAQLISQQALSNVLNGTLVEGQNITLTADQNNNTMYLTPPKEGEMIPYEFLTEEIVLNWLKTQYGPQRIETIAQDLYNSMVGADDSGFVNESPFESVVKIDDIT